MSDQVYWDSVYRQKSPEELSWHQSNPDLSIDLIQQTGAQAESGVIDVGGGTLVLTAHLLKAGFLNLAVLDISTKALLVNQMRLGEQARMIDWYQSDVKSFRPEKSYAVWHDRAVFHFLTDEKDKQEYLTSLKFTLDQAESGHVIIASFALNGPKRCSGLDVVRYDAEKISKTFGMGFTLQAVCSESHITPKGQTQAFNYFRFHYHA